MLKEILVIETYKMMKINKCDYQKINSFELIVEKYM